MDFSTTISMCKLNHKHKAKHLDKRLSIFCETKATNTLRKILDVNTFQSGTNSIFSQSLNSQANYVSEESESQYGYNRHVENRTERITIGLFGANIIWKLKKKCINSIHSRWQPAKNIQINWCTQFRCRDSFVSAITNRYGFLGKNENKNWSAFFLPHVNRWASSCIEIGCKFIVSESVCYPCWP